MGESEPRQIGSYDVLAKLADGGVGTVYLARRRGPADFRRLVAIKRLHPQFATDPGFVTMFTDEARLAARIHHANVVSIVELGADADGYYVVMEYVEGSNLGHFHWHATRGAGSASRMPRAVALRIVLDALSGLHAAHEIEDDDGTIVNLVHRDVSPQNILLGMDGLARLGDFGIARASALREFETRGPAIKGKLEYMAPEQLECKPVDRTTDLFAMGIVLWELLTSRRLFSTNNQVTTIQRVCFDPIPSPRSVDPSVSAELERICLRALERPRAKRYPTAAAFAEDLERAARADAGIATQREVAACMIAVLRSETSDGRGAVRELGRRAPAADVPDLAGEVRGHSPTHQLPQSDPMMKLPPASLKRTAPMEQHPPISGESSSTEPYGAVPPPGVGVGAGAGPGESVTVHYDEGVPFEIIAEARMASRSAMGSEPTIVRPEQQPQPSSPPQPPPSSQPQSQPQSQPHSGQPLSGQPHSGQPHSGQPHSGQPHSGQPHSGQPQSQPHSGPPRSGQPLSSPPQPMPSAHRHAAPRASSGAAPAPRAGLALAAVAVASVMAISLAGLGIVWLSRAPGPPPRSVASATASSPVVVAVASAESDRDPAPAAIAPAAIAIAPAASAAASASADAAVTTDDTVTFDDDPADAAPTAIAKPPARDL